MRSLRIKDGVATADFSKELWAYDGGLLRVKLMHEQIAHTLKQFPSVREGPKSNHGSMWFDNPQALKRC
ncbi:MAG TPA: GerMN domain-containing protein [Roseiflexaceae bacterium]